jgi:hypothetical protein
MLNNINNFFNLVRGKRIKTTLAPNDLIPVGVRDVTNKSDYQPAAIQYSDLQTQLGGIQSVSATSPLASTGGVNPTLSITQATSLTDGYLSAADWSTFNGKVDPTRTISTTAPLQGGGDLSADRTFSIDQANSTTDGYLSSTDWNTFNNKLDQAYTTVEDEGIPLTQRSTINFVGAGVTVTDVGGKTEVSITGGGAGSTLKTVQLGILEASTAAALALLSNQLILNHVGSGAGVIFSTRWQFVIPADFVSGGEVVLDVQRPGNASSASLLVYVNGVISNINGISFNPTAAGVWQTFTIALTTPVVAGDTITVLGQPTLTNGQNLYIRDSYFNYQS